MSTHSVKYHPASRRQLVKTALITLVNVGIVLGLLWLFTGPAEQAHAAVTHSAIATDGCGSGYAKYSIETLNSVDAEYIASADRVRGEDSASFICSNDHGEMVVYGTTNCWTYHGVSNPDGDGSTQYLDVIACADKASQEWTQNGGELKNDYTGGTYCLYGPGVGNNLTMNTCNPGNNNDLWSENPA